MASDLVFVRVLSFVIYLLVGHVTVRPSSKASAISATVLVGGSSFAMRFL